MVAVSILPNHENGGNFNEIASDFAQTKEIFPTIRKSKYFEIHIPTNNFIRRSHHSEK